MRIPVFRSFFSLWVALAFIFSGLLSASAEEFHCEVLTVEGKVLATDPDGNERTLQEGECVALAETVALLVERRLAGVTWQAPLDPAAPHVTAPPEPARRAPVGRLLLAGLFLALKFRQT